MNGAHGGAATVGASARSVNGRYPPPRTPPPQHAAGPLLFVPMTTPITLLCPGQGAQRVGMGLAWRDHAPAAAQTFGAADEALGDALGAPLSTLCFEGPADVLSRTDVAQPAIFVTSVACHQALFADGPSVEVRAVAGLSLGEYTALHLAGVFSFEDALRLVALRGRAMQDAAEAAPSSMVALIGAAEGQANEVCEKAAQGDVLVPANYNAPGQIVLSGAVEACSRAVEVAAEVGCRAIALDVAGAFHSPFMQPAADRLREALAQTDLHEPRCPVWSNVTGQRHDADADSIRARLVSQLTSPVKWAQGCANLIASVSEPAEDSGDADAAIEYHELAPGKVLAGLMKKIDRAAKVQTHDEP